jgi:CDP-glucose 4,6-dehydratase
MLKNVLVTGATGLVGGYTVEQLLKNGYKVFALQRKPNPDSYLFTSGLYKQCEIISLNILDIKSLDSLVKKEKINYIVHLAAQLKVVSLYETFNFNILGTLNLVEVVKNNKQIKGLVLASTNRAYQNGLTKNEFKQLLKSPYDLSKTVAQQLAQSYLNYFDVPIVTACFGNVYGAGDSQKRIIPQIVKHIVSGKTLELKLSPARRSYIFGRDVAKGIVLTLKNFSKLMGQSVGLETKELFSVKELIQNISKIVGKPCKFKVVGKMHDDIAYKKIDQKLGAKIFKWKPETNFEAGILETYKWYRQNSQKVV